MKATSISCLLALLALPAAALFPTSAPARAPASAAREDADPQFRTRFQKALDAAQKPELVKLVKSDAKNAVLTAVEVAQSLAKKPDPADEALLAALGEAWRTAFKGEFVAKVQAYYAGLSGDKAKTHADLAARWKAASREFEGNLEKKDGLVFMNIVDELEALGGGFESEGDLYLASEAYRCFAACHDEPLRAGGADLHRAWKGLGYAIEAREKLELKDPLYDELVKRRTLLASRGAAEKGGAKAGEAPVATGPAQPAGEAQSVAMVFEALASFDAFQRPVFASDEIYEIWPQIPVKAKGSATSHPTNNDVPAIVRVGSSDVRFDVNGDGQGDEKIPLTGNIVPIKIQIGKDKRPWAFFATIGVQKDSYQGIEVNLSPSEDQMVIFSLGAASVVGSVGGTSVRVIDDSQDGAYGNKPLSWGTSGMTKEHFEPILDSVVIGSSKRARPWSEFQEIDGKWYKLEVKEAGAKLDATPLQLDTGVLKLEFKGPTPPTYVVVVGSDDTKDSYFDLVEGGSKGINVPAGRYSLFYGEVRKGKKKQMQKTLVLPAKQGEPSWDVKKGATTVVELGAPFGFDFRFDVDGEKLLLKGESIVITGAHGERYERAWNCVARPEAAWRKKGSKKASKYEKLVLCQDNEQINKLGWGAPWAPLDHEFDVKGQGSSFELQLIDKKHDLFGKIESAWKE